MIRIMQFYAQFIHFDKVAIKLLYRKSIIFYLSVIYHNFNEYVFENYVMYLVFFSMVVGTVHVRLERCVFPLAHISNISSPSMACPPPLNAYPSPPLRYSKYECGIMSRN